MSVSMYINDEYKVSTFFHSKKHFTERNLVCISTSFSHNFQLVTEVIVIIIVNKCRITTFTFCDMVTCLHPTDVHTHTYTFSESHPC